MLLKDTGPVHEEEGPTQYGANWHMSEPATTVPLHACVLDASTTHSPETPGPV